MGSTTGTACPQPKKDMKQHGFSTHGNGGGGHAPGIRFGNTQSKGRKGGFTLGDDGSNGEDKEPGRGNGNTKVKDTCKREKVIKKDEVHP